MKCCRKEEVIRRKKNLSGMEGKEEDRNMRGVKRSA